MDDKVNQAQVKKNSAMHEFLIEFSTVFGFCQLMTNFFGYPLLAYYLLFYTKYWYLVLLYLAWIYYDRDTPHTGGRKFKWGDKSLMGKYGRDYYPVTLVKTAELPPNKNYVFSVFPHGMLCFGGSVNFMNDRTVFKKMFPGLDLYMTTLATNFYIPVTRELMLSSGTIAVSEKGILSLLNKKPRSGTVCTIIVGGAAEAFYSYPDDEYKIILKNRKGFVRVALKTGASLVPVFCFGETETFDQVRSSWLRSIEEKLYRLTGYAPVIPLGRKFGPFYLPFPRRVPINTVVGRPIDLPKIENPTAEEITKYHELYKKELYDLFEAHKEKQDPRGKKARLVYV